MRKGGRWGKDACWKLAACDLLECTEHTLGTLNTLRCAFHPLHFPPLARLPARPLQVCVMPR